MTALRGSTAAAVSIRGTPPAQPKGSASLGSLGRGCGAIQCRCSEGKGLPRSAFSALCTCGLPLAPLAVQAAHRLAPQGLDASHGAHARDPGSPAEVRWGSKGVESVGSCGEGESGLSAPQSKNGIALWP